jgi:hypothetical protein
MSVQAETLTFDWHGIAVSVSVSQPGWLNACRRAGGASFVHLEIHAAEPLPITETGYVSHFVIEEALSAEGGPRLYVRTWLDVLAT